MKKYLKLFIGGIIVLGIVLFIVTSFKKSSHPPQVALPPAIESSPVRIYGMIEPAGREVFVSPPLTKRVTEIYAREGAIVQEGEPLLVLENSVEEKQVDLAQAKVAQAQKALELSIDNLNRTKKLYARNIDSEYKYTQAEITKALDLKRLKVANNELDVAKAQFEQTILRSPVTAVLYKFDVRLGETLTAGDNTKIMLGASELWVRLFLESFWKNRVALGSRFRVYDSETGEEIGTGTVRYLAPYLGRRDFRTEDTQERFDTKFQEVVLELKSETTVPIGLSVVAELEQP